VPKLKDNWLLTLILVDTAASWVIWKWGYLKKMRSNWERDDQQHGPQTGDFCKEDARLSTLSGVNKNMATPSMKKESTSLSLLMYFTGVIQLLMEWTDKYHWQDLYFWDAGQSYSFLVSWYDNILQAPALRCVILNMGYDIRDCLMEHCTAFNNSKYTFTVTTINWYHASYIPLTIPRNLTSLIWTTSDYKSWEHFSTRLRSSLKF
jgi:hypothetical protein